MRRILIAWLALVTALCLTSCGGKPQIRIANRSSVPLENVRVRFPSQTEEYGTIPPHGVSEYREVARAYATPYVEAMADGLPAVLSPIDHVGDRLLRSGRYTYALTVRGSARSAHDRLGFQFVTD